jgi:hypothetical protein
MQARVHGSDHAEAGRQEAAAFGTCGGPVSAEDALAEHYRKKREHYGLHRDFYESDLRTVFRFTV